VLSRRSKSVRAYPIETKRSAEIFENDRDGVDSYGWNMFFLSANNNIIYYYLSEGRTMYYPFVRGVSTESFADRKCWNLTPANVGVATQQINRTRKWRGEIRRLARDSSWSLYVQSAHALPSRNYLLSFHHLYDVWFVELDDVCSVIRR